MHQPSDLFRTLDRTLHALAAAACSYRLSPIARRSGDPSATGLLAITLSLACRAVGRPSAIVLGLYGGSLTASGAMPAEHYLGRHGLGFRENSIRPERWRGSAPLTGTTQPATGGSAPTSRTSLPAALYGPSVHYTGTNLAMLAMHQAPAPPLWRWTKLLLTGAQACLTVAGRAGWNSTCWQAPGLTKKATHMPPEYHLARMFRRISPAAAP